MRPLLAALLVLSLATIVTGDDKPAKDAQNFEALKKEFDDAVKEFATAQRDAQKQVKDATTDEEKKDAQQKLEKLLAGSPSLKYGPRFLDFAERHPKDPAAMEALQTALRISMPKTGGAPKAPKDQGGTFERVLTHLKKDWADKPEIKGVFRQLANVDDDGVTKLFEEIVAKNADHKLQAQACKAVSNSHKHKAELAEGIKDNEKMRAYYEKQMGKDNVAKLLASEDQHKKEAEKWMNRLYDKYSDLYADLRVGKKAPELISEGLDGKETKLSDLRGKVVVLDIWATWCGPCRAMIPHEREMVEHLKDKPFVLVSISGDDKKEALTSFLEKEKMPWTHWWNGRNPRLMEKWDIEYFPTIIVLDAKGVIRHKGLRGEALEKAVEHLLKEMEDKK